MYPRFLSPPSLKHYVARWKLDKRLLEKKIQDGGDKSDIELLELRIKRHERDIVDYVTSERFEQKLKSFNL